MIRRFLPFVTCLGLLSCQNSNQPSKATILYFNDAHQIMPVVDDLGERGGVARLKAVVNRIREENPDSLLVFGGDLAGGTLFGGLYKGFPMVEAFNRIELDLAAFGQHDFDFGIDNTRQLVEKSEFQWITTNLVESSDAPFGGLKRYRVVALGGLRIGFIGLTDAMDTTTQDDQVKQRDLILAAKEAVDELRGQRTDAIIAITQTGLETNERLLLEIPELIAILTEERSENRTKVDFVGGRPIAAPCGNMGSVVGLDLVHDGKKVQVSVQAYPVDETITPDPELAALEEHYRQEMKSELETPVAVLTDPLDARITTDHATRWRETAIGNAIADAFRAHYTADIGMINGGGIRASLPEGEVTRKDILSVLPFRNNVVLVGVNGQQVRTALEHGLNRVESLGGGFLQVSGLRYEYDWGKPPGQRLSDVWVNGKSLDPDIEYSAAIPSHLYSGGDGFTVFSNGRLLAGLDQAPIDAEVFTEYLQSLSVAGPVEVKTSQRIVVRNKK